jgi:hypothetical protein
MTLEGTGTLPNSSPCHIHAENFKLLWHSLGRTTVFLNRTHIVPPSIENVLNFPEGKSLLQFNAGQSMDLRRLEGIVERATSRSQARGIEVNKLTTAVQADTIITSPHAGYGSLALLLYRVFYYLPNPAVL